jgi:1-acyl-sn-glycerol-3-phosphate acyltransferase
LLGQLKIGIKNGLYAIIAILCLVMLKLLFRIRVQGRENISKQDEYIAVARHRSYWDPPILTVAIGAFTPVHYISRKGLMHGIPLVTSIIRTFSTIIDRENFSRDDFRRVLAAMKQERVIGLFPEGTTTREQVDAKTGVIHFARLSGKRILPVNIIAKGPFPAKYPFHLPKLTVSIGKSFTIADLQNDEFSEVTRAAQYQQMSEQLMFRVDNA